MKMSYLALMASSLVLPSYVFAVADLPAAISTTLDSVSVGDTVSAVSTHDKQAVSVKSVWVNGRGEVIGKGRSLSVTRDIANAAAKFRVCERQTLADGKSLTGCSTYVPIVNREVKGTTPETRDAPPAPIDITVIGFPAIGESLTANYTFTDPDGDSEVAEGTQYGWQYAKASDTSVWKSLGLRTKSIVVPKMVGSESLAAGDLIRVVIKVTSDGVGSPTSEPAFSGEQKLFDNYPGGNIADKYYRPLLTSETVVDEGVKNTYTVDGSGEPTESSGYDFAILTQAEAVSECEGYGLRLITDAADFTAMMNEQSVSGGDVEKWPKHKAFWTNQIDEADIFGDYFSVANYDGGETPVFQARATNGIAKALVVCQK